MAPLIIGALLAASGLAFVLAPLLLGSPGPRAVIADGRHPAQGVTPSDDSDLGPGITAVDVLREIEFDRATGKLSESDYGSLKSTYTARALAELRRGAGPTGPGAPASGEQVTAVEAGVLAARRVCGACGASSPSDAVYCVQCAAYLATSCPACHGPVRLPAARFCSWCGLRFAQERPAVRA